MLGFDIALLITLPSFESTSVFLTSPLVLGI